MGHDSCIIPETVSGPVVKSFIQMAPDYLVQVQIQGSESVLNITNSTDNKKTLKANIAIAYLDLRLNKKAFGIKAQPLEDFILGSSPSAGI